MHTALLLNKTKLDTRKELQKLPLSHLTADGTKQVSIPQTAIYISTSVKDLDLSGLKQISAEDNQC